MKRATSVFKIVVGIGLIGLTMLGAIALFSAEPFKNAQPATAPTAQPTRTQGAATPPGLGPARLTPPVKVRTPSSRFFPEALQGDLLIGREEANISTIDLKSGQIAPIFSIPGLGFINASERWIVGVEIRPAEETNYGKLHAYDRTQRKEVPLPNQVRSGKGNLDLSDSTLVWHDYRHDDLKKLPQFDIYGYRLEKQQEFPIVERPGVHLYPRIAGDWVAYIEYFGALGMKGLPITTTLRAVNISTKEDLVIGLMPQPLDPLRGLLHAIGGSKIAWNSCASLDVLRGCNVHLYDLQTKTDRIVANGLRVLQYVSDDLLLYSGDKGTWILYDLKYNTPAATIRQTTGVLIADVQISGQRMVWAESERKADYVYTLYTATLIR